jgi:NAD(P)-dependent dehydrogenase (short-subunit alcohol dehydrogenase family)
VAAEIESSDRPRRDLDGAVAVVIGGGPGIGGAVALELSAAGAAVVVAGRSAERLAATQAAAAASGDHIAAASVDVADVASIRQLALDVSTRLGPPSILVNSAGVSVTKPALEVTEDDWDRVHSVDLRGVFFACQAFGAVMADAGYGKIVNLGSTWGATVGSGRSVYSAAKAGVHHLTAALATEWGPLGIRVNAVAPSITRTPRVVERFAANPEREAYALDRIPLGRIAGAADVAGAVAYLASPGSDFVTGHTLFVDGGWRLSK